MHASGRVVIVAAGLAAAIAATAFGVQAIGLPRPQPGPLLGAEAVGPLGEWRIADFRGRLNRIPVSGTCVQGVLPARGKATVRGTAVLVDGDRILALGSRISQFGQERVRRALARTELRLACPLGAVLVRQLERRALTVKRTRIDGFSAEAFRFRLGSAWLTYAVDARTHLPLWIAIHARKLSGTADLQVLRDDRRQVLRVLTIFRRRDGRDGFADRA